jgi:DNA-binding transcriptional regulator YdaS (Cro superfamily)
MENDSVAVKIRKFLDDNGVKMSWFAESIGISTSALSRYIKGQGPLPKKCWKKVVVATRGKISLKEIVQEVLLNAEEFSDED